MKAGKWFTAVVLFSCALPLLAQVAVTARSPPAFSAQRSPTFGKADRDHDGRLKRSEIPREFVLLRARFDDFDVNHDGYLEADEIVAYIARSGGGAGLDMRRLEVGPTVILHPLEIPSGHGVDYD